MTYRQKKYSPSSVNRRVIIAALSAVWVGACGGSTADKKYQSKPSDPVKKNPTNRQTGVLIKVKADINHYIVSGQSLSVAGSSAWTIDQADLMLSSGLHAPLNSVNSLAQLQNTNSDGILYAAIGQLKFLCAGNMNFTGDPNYFDDYKILASGHGVSGAGIVNLSPGGATQAYNNGLWQIEESVRLAHAISKTLVVPVISWIQGESDGYTNPEIYQKALIALKNNYNSDIQTRTGQKNRVPMLCYQISSEQHDKPAGIEYEPHAAAATFWAMEVDSEIIIAAPTYWVEHRDGLHFDPDHYRLFGQMWGKVLYKRIYRGEAWQPLRPLKIMAVATDLIEVQLHVPEPPLVFDTQAVVDPGHYGFDVRDTTGRIPILDVAIIDNNRVRVRLGRAMGAAPMLSYAWYSLGGQPGGPATGPRGCLRDSDATIGIFDPVALPNWCLRFKKAVEIMS